MGIFSFYTCLTNLSNKYMMKKSLPFLAILISFTSISNAQVLVSSEYLGHTTASELEQFDTPILNGADSYRLIYETTDLDGSITQVSGLLAIPDDLTKRYPRAVYQHGTAPDDMGVPSFNSVETNLALTLCGKGYVVCAPDLLGLGVDDGLHPYVHAESEAWVAADMLRAADQFLEENNVEVNDQMFVTGYSQGGHSAMALHKMMEEELSSEFTVTASAPMSGPYNISGVMRDLVFSEEEYSNPGYLVYTLVSYQEVYGNLYASVEEAVKEPYQDLVIQFANDEIGLGDMNEQLIELLNTNEGAVVAGKTFKDDYVDAILNTPDHPVNIALADNDVHEWNAAAPTRLYYCMADEQVPFENSIVAQDAMTDAGTADVEAIDVNSFLSHAFCALFAPREAADFFAQYQVIEDLPPSSTFEEADTALEIYPNPATDRVIIKNFPTEGNARIFDLHGRLMLSQKVQLGDNIISINHLPEGMYMVEVLSGNQFWKEKLMVK